MSNTSSPPTPIICPYCGHQHAESAKACERCRGLFEPLSRQASQNAMGPWFIRDEANPFRPGCGYETLQFLISKGRIKPNTILRGPTTRQFWMLAGRTPGVAHLMGACHSCQAAAEPTAALCVQCGARFDVPADRQHLGLADVRLLPGQASASAVARSAMSSLSSMSGSTESRSSRVLGEPLPLAAPEPDFEPSVERHARAEPGAFAQPTPPAGPSSNRPATHSGLTAEELERRALERMHVTAAATDSDRQRVRIVIFAMLALIIIVGIIAFAGIMILGRGTLGGPAASPAGTPGPGIAPPPGTGEGSGGGTGPFAPPPSGTAAPVGGPVRGRSGQ